MKALGLKTLKNEYCICFLPMFAKRMLQIERKKKTFFPFICAHCYMIYSPIKPKKDG